MSESDRLINLMPQRERRDTTAERGARRVSVVLLAFFIIVGAGTIGIWSAVYVFSQQIQATEQQITALQTQISSLSKKEQKIQLLANRLKDITSILKTRPSFEIELDQITASLPQGVEILSAELEKSGKTAVVKIESATYGGFREALSVFQGGSFSRVDLKDISRDHDGTYSVDLVLILS